MIKATHVLLALLVILIVLGCTKDPVDGPEIKVADGFFILNEGRFNMGDASLGYYDFETGTYNEKVFQNTNGRILGDILQSMEVVNDKAYLVMNNANVVEIMDVKSFQSLGTIGNFPSPRYLAPVDNKKAYLSDLFSGFLYVLDLETGIKTDSIDFSGKWTENLLLHEAILYVSTPTLFWGPATKHIYLVDTQNDMITDSIEVGYNPSVMVKDHHDMIWVYCSGNEDENVTGGLFVIDPLQKKVAKSLLFDDYIVPFAPELKINADKDSLYYLKGDIFALDTDANSLPSAPFIASEGKSIYALGIAPQGDVLIGDAIDFQQKGEVWRYDAQGNLITSFQSGISPSDFVFY